MATLETQDANIIDADAINWRLVVYPVVGVILILLVGFTVYYYQQNARDQAEYSARQAFIQAKTPDELVKVADQYPGTSQGVFALIAAADLSMTKSDYPAAEKDYQRVIGDAGADQILRDSAGVGLGSAYEAENKLDDAIGAFLNVAHRGKSSPYAPYAYMSAARLYDRKKDPAAERNLLTEAAALGGDSSFVKEADYQLKLLKLISENPKSALPPASAPAAPPPATNAAH